MQERSCCSFGSSLRTAGPETPFRDGVLSVSLMTVVLSLGRRETRTYDADSISMRGIY